MTIIPAIDMLDGACVRLLQGSYDEVTNYDKDPVAVAREFERAGVRRIHLVDLDAVRGSSARTNRKKIRKIRKAVTCELQVGGGIRSDDDIEELMDLGIDRIVVGTLLARKPDLVAGWVAHYGKVFIAGIDALDGVVKVSGWQTQTQVSDLELAKRAASVGVAAIVYTSISHDGTMEGPDLERTKLVAAESKIPVILSGGVGSMDHLRLVSEAGIGTLVGVILGKSIYEGTVKVEEAVSTFENRGEEEVSW